VKRVIRFDVRKGAEDLVWDQIVLRFDEFDDSDEMLDEGTLCCIDTELLMAGIWGTNSALLRQENESLCYLTCAFESEVRLDGVLMVRVDSTAITETKLCRITSLTIRNGGATISRQNFIV
jgi:hypothetical protein